MLHDDHVFSDDLTEEELENLLAELDREESASVSIKPEPSQTQKMDDSIHETAVTQEIKPKTELESFEDGLELSEAFLADDNKQATSDKKQTSQYDVDGFLDVHLLEDKIDSQAIELVEEAVNNSQSAVNQLQTIESEPYELSNDPQYLKLSKQSQNSAQLIQQQVAETKEQLRLLQDTFRKLTDSSAQMIAETRHLQNSCKDDFSVTYEQMHQLRKRIIQTCRDIGSLPSMLDIVEEAMESDLYVAETRNVE